MTVPQVIFGETSGPDWANEVADAVNAAQAPWQSFDPTGNATGNGTFSGRYRQVGFTVEFAIHVTVGTTTTTAGVWNGALPVTPSAAMPRICFPAFVFDGAARRPAVGFESGDTVLVRATDPSEYVDFGNLADGDTVTVSGTYEAATAA